jgi:hypothetical protein
MASNNFQSTLSEIAKLLDVTMLGIQAKIAKNFLIAYALILIIYEPITE